jgi:hypothetical protein
MAMPADTTEKPFAIIRDPTATADEQGNPDLSGMIESGIKRSLNGPNLTTKGPI